MAEYQTAKSYVDTSQAIDVGLKAHMNKVYGLMSLAMLITGAVAFAVGTYENDQGELVLVNAIFGTWLSWVVMLAPLGVVFMFGAKIHSMSTATAQSVFWLFAALIGLSISYIFAAFTGISIAQTFLTTAVAFGALSLYGYTTKRDLTALGSFMFIGLIGIIVASIANWFFQSEVMHLAISAIGVLIFAGLTAYDTQNIKNTYLQYRSAYGEEYAEKMGIMGALSLYLNFLNMFMFLLQFMGNRD